jgi:hypothetical protein
MHVASNAGAFAFESRFAFQLIHPARSSRRTRPQERKQTRPGGASRRGLHALTLAARRVAQPAKARLVLRSGHGSIPSVAATWSR